MGLFGICCCWLGGFVFVLGVLGCLMLGFVVFFCLWEFIVGVLSGVCVSVLVGSLGDCWVLWLGV